MTEKTRFIPYQPKTILNSHKRVDHWFWSRYSAYPYQGCQHGCKFCYAREEKYSPYDNADEFATTIKVKENAANLLRRALSRKPVDIVCLGDYQPAERKFRITRQMLEVCRDLGFPVFMLSRSPLILRDLDVLQQINHQATSAVAFSIISTPDSSNHPKVVKMEHLAPRVEKRFAAMQEIAKAGILTGTCFMPILPGICDDEANLENVVRWTAESGGKFVLASSLTLADKQKDFFFDFLQESCPELLDSYRHWYPPGSYAPWNYDWEAIALRVRDLCHRYGISDRMPRPIIPGDKFTVNKRIVEQLANTAYVMEINHKPTRIIWEYRKAAWAVEDLQTDIRLVYATMGIKGLQSIPGIPESIIPIVEKIIAGFY